jgi:hypothetical protein
MDIIPSNQVTIFLNYGMMQTLQAQQAMPRVLFGKNYGTYTLFLVTKLYSGGLFRMLFLLRVL